MAVRQLLKQETILTIIMITVTTILIIGATVAWFLGNRPVTIQNYFQQAGGIDGIDVKMAIVPGATGAEGSSESEGTGECDTQDTNIEVEEGITYYTMNAINANNKVIDVDLADLTNIEEGKLGPGSYGTIKFKISTTSEEEMKYIIRITPSIEVVEGVAEKSTEENKISKELLLDLVQNHIKFYAVKTESVQNGNKDELTNVYQEVIPYYFETSSENSSDVTSDDTSNDTSNESSSNVSETNENSEAKAIEKTGLTGTVSADSDNVVTIYWYWPYEYTDIPGYSIENYNSPNYNPWNVVEKQNTAGGENDSNSVEYFLYEGKYSSELSLEDRIEAYDWDDTKIGNYVTALKFHFEVSTYQ